MKFYLSGANKAESVQTSPQLSLGGFLSSTRVPNNRIGFLFDNLSSFDKFNGSTDCKALFLVNDIQDFTSLKMTFVGSFEEKFELGVVSTENQYIEKISSRNDLPFDTELFETKSSRASTIVKFLTNPSVSEIVTLMGVTVTSESTDISSLIDKFVTAFSNTNYFARKLSTTELALEKKDIGLFTQAGTFSTAGTTTIQASNFSSGVDNSLLISNDFKKDDVLGIWVRRIVQKQEISDSDLIQNLENNPKGKLIDVELLTIYS